jgi:hypothetical protein
VISDQLLAFHTFAPYVWGTVGQWGSAIGTVSAFLATFYVIRRDAKERRESQARKVAFHLDEVHWTILQSEAEEGEERGASSMLVLSNSSDQPIYDVMLRAGGPEDGRKYSYDSATIKVSAIMLPGTKISLRYFTDAHPSEMKSSAIFRDNSNHHWRRDLRGNLGQARYSQYERRDRARLGWHP